MWRCVRAGPSSSQIRAIRFAPTVLDMPFRLWVARPMAAPSLQSTASFSAVMRWAASAWNCSMSSVTNASAESLAAGSLN